MTQAINYDDVAPTYNRRFDERYDLKGIAAALAGLARRGRARAILEVGCGTARWLADLRPATGNLFGLDLSAGMLAQARQRDGRVSLARGNAGRLPFPAASFDFVYCVNALHHFDRKREFIWEVRRVLRPGGALAVIGMSPRHSQTQWYIYGYFEGALEADLARFPRWGRVRQWLTMAGFEPFGLRTVERIDHNWHGWEVLSDPFLDKNATSQLTLLSDGAYAEGLRRIREELEKANAAGEDIYFPDSIVIQMLVVRVPRKL